MVSGADILYPNDEPVNVVISNTTVCKSSSNPTTLLPDIVFVSPPGVTQFTKPLEFHVTPAVDGINNFPVPSCHDADTGAITNTELSLLRFTSDTVSVNSTECDTPAVFIASH